MEITEFCISGFIAQCAVCIYGIYGACLKWMLPGRALVFRPLVKGNEALGTRLISYAIAVCLLEILIRFRSLENSLSARYVSDVKSMRT